MKKVAGVLGETRGSLDRPSRISSSTLLDRWLIPVDAANLYLDRAGFKQADASRAARLFGEASRMNPASQEIRRIQVNPLVSLVAKRAIFRPLVGNPSTMKTFGFFFRTFLFAVFTLSLVAGAIATDYYLRHEITRKAERFLAANGVEPTTASAIAAAERGEIAFLDQLEYAGVSLGLSDESGRTPLLAAIQSRNLQVVEHLISRSPVLEAINQATAVDRVTPLAAALRERDFRLAGELIDLGALVDIDAEVGVPFIVAAVRSGDGETLEFLLSRGADPDYRGAYPVTALAVAAGASDLETMERLLEAGASPDARGSGGKPLLIEAAAGGEDAIFDLLLDRGALPDIAVNGGGPDRETALSHAVARDDVRMQEALLAAGASPDAGDPHGVPLLLRAIAAGDGVTASRLLDAGAACDVALPGVESPLLAAVGNDDLELVGLLLAHGASPGFAPEGGPTPMRLAVESGDVAIAGELLRGGASADDAELIASAYASRNDPLLLLLLESGADPEALIPGTETRVFDRAVQDGATGAVRTLLSAGASIGDNLWAALLTEQDDLIRLILDAGADPTQAGPEGQDPLAYCLTLGRYKAARDLLAGGADPNARFDSEETWVARAVRQGDEEIALALVQAGASVADARARDGHSLLGWSIAHNMTSVAKALIEAGADVNAEERAPATPEFREMFSANTFRYHLQVDRRIRPIMMAAAQRNHDIAQALMDAGANGRAYTPRYLMAAIIGSWYKDVRMQQICLIGHSPRQQPRKVVISLSSQRVTYYENDVAKFSAPVSTGKPGHRTPTGEYVISDRNRHHVSNIYHSSMPFFQRFSFSAFGLHQGHLPGYPASAGCIRLNRDAAAFLWGKLQVGDYALIVP